MARVNLRERIRQGLFLLDGAMGTQLFLRGVEVGKCNDYLNIESPDVIFDIHKAYLKAGSDAVLTNTFGANKYALARHGFDKMVKEINTEGAKIARRAAGEGKYVLGDIGPTGDFLEPLGSLKPEEVKEAFAQQAKALLAGGVDGFIIETMAALEELMLIIKAAKSVSKLPVFVSLAFDKVGDDFKTMMGVDVETAVAQVVSLGVDAIGFNCGKVPLENYIKLAAKYVSTLKTLKQDVAVLAEPNAGLPELVDGRAVYNVSSDDFAATVQKIHLLGVNIIGGCCGTGPADIEAAAKKMKKQ